MPGQASQWNSRLPDGARWRPSAPGPIPERRNGTAGVATASSRSWSLAQACMPARRRQAARAPHAAFVRGDMRHIPLATGAFDAVICMWQSFGHFDDKQNAAAVREMTRVLRPGGVLVLDIYHRVFHEGRLGHSDIEREGV